jgi:hypothetical protein
MFAQLLSGQEVVGVAAGVRSRCRLSRRPRHYYFPTLPALGGPAHPDELLTALVSVLRSYGAGEVVFDSFDARWEPGIAALEPAARQEYFVSLETPVSEQVARFRTLHRRHLRDGVREAWTLRTLEGEDARTLLHGVLAAATRRRGDPFAVEVSAAATRSPGPALTAAWGTRLFSAWHNATPLAAVLIGWANRRAYYLLGGSTVEGYHRSASVWLHWSIMSHFAHHGFITYNLGGTPASAVRPQDPAHGLFRFKSGFGSQVVRCQGTRWTFDRTHVRVHRLARWALDRFRIPHTLAESDVPEALGRAHQTV